MQPTKLNTLFGERVASLRTAAELSQAELASRLSEVLGKKMDPTTVTRMEKGTRPTSVVELYALGEIFGVSASDLMPPELPAQRTLHWYQSRRQTLEREFNDAAWTKATIEAHLTYVAAAIDAARRLINASQAGRPLREDDLRDLETVAREDRDGLQYNTFADLIREFLPDEESYLAAERWAIVRLRDPVHAAVRPPLDIELGLIEYLRQGCPAEDSSIPPYQPHQPANDD